MKKIKMYGLIALGSMMIFAGCTKDNNSVSPATISTAQNGNTENVVATPGVTVNMITVPSATGNAFQWTDGNLTTNEMYFLGTHVVGNMLSREQFGTDVTTTAKLFSNASLGNIFVSPEYFNYVQFSVQLNAANSGSAFFLNGTYNLNGQLLPVQLIINEQVTLNTVYIDNITISDLKSYSANLYLDVNELTTNLSADMLANAEKTNGTIIISKTSNTELYRQILTNLTNEMLKVQFSGASTQNTGTSVTLPAS